MLKRLVDQIVFTQNIKNYLSNLPCPLSLLLKLSYNTGSLPKEWNMANCCIVVHAKGGKDNVENYRPISLTSLVMKTFEHIIKQELPLRASHLFDIRQNEF